MTVISLDGRDDDTVKTRLIRAADAEIADHGINEVRMEAIAKRAGVSRATVFRQLGTASEVLIQVAMLRAQRHITAVRELMQTKTGAFAKIEAALIYTSRELPTDPTIAQLMAQHSTSVHDARVHAAAMDVMTPVLEEGRASGEIRADLELDELVDFLVEQTYTAAEEIDRSEDAVRRRFRHFVAPAIEARNTPGGELISRTSEARTAISAAVAALQTLSGQLGRTSGADSQPG